MKRTIKNLSELADQRHKGECTIETTPAMTEVQHLADIPSATVNVEQLKLALTDRVLVTPEVLDSLPSTHLLTPMVVKYHIKKVTPSRYNLRSKGKLRKNEHPSKEVSTYSESTELYWSPDEEEYDEGSKVERSQTRVVKKKAQFKYRIHGIRQSKRKYNLRCVVTGCNKVSHSVETGTVTIG